MNLPPQRATTAEKGLIFYLPPRFTFARRKGIGHMPPGENVNSKGFQFPRKEATFHRPARRRSKPGEKKSQSPDVVRRRSWLRSTLLLEQVRDHKVALAYSIENEDHQAKAIIIYDWLPLFHQSGENNSNNDATTAVFLKFTKIWLWLLGIPPSVFSREQK